MTLFTTILMIIAAAAAVAALLYLLLILPGMRKHPDIQQLRKVLYAHRGLHDNSSDAPENSMAAFARAVEAGFGIELDVQLTKDQVPVVFHDYTLKRICGVEGRVDAYTFEELQQFHLCDSEQRIPKFEEVLKLIDGRVPLIIEYKIEATNPAVCAAADVLLQHYRGLYCIESFNPMGLYWYRKNRPDIVRGQLSDAFHTRGELKGALYFLLENLLLNFLTAPDFIAYNHRYPKKLSRRLCRGLFGNTAVCWTIKNETELAEAQKDFDMFIFDSFVPEQKSRM